MTVTDKQRPGTALACSTPLGFQGIDTQRHKHTHTHTNEEEATSTDHVPTADDQHQQQTQPSPAPAPEQPTQDIPVPAPQPRPGSSSRSRGPKLPPATLAALRTARDQAQTEGREFTTADIQQVIKLPAPMAEALLADLTAPTAA